MGLEAVGSPVGLLLSLLLFLDVQLEHLAPEGQGLGLLDQLLVRRRCLDALSTSISGGRYHRRVKELSTTLMELNAMAMAASVGGSRTCTKG